MRSQLSLLRCRLRVFGIPIAGLLLMGGAHGQSSVATEGAQHTMEIVPRVSMTETFTDNVRLSTTAQQGEQITTISPGIRISRDGGRIKGFFDYSANEVLYAQNTSGNQHQNALNAQASMEVVDNWMKLDLSGTISQQSISAFATPSSDNASISANKTEVSSYRISPFVSGRLGSLANYEALYSRAITQSAAVMGSSVAITDGVVKIGGRSANKNLGWSVDASHSRVEYSAARTTEDERLNLGLSYAITPQLSVSANGGRENSNFSSLNSDSYATSGIGASWSPSEMSRLSVTRSNRSFGEAHGLSFEHRTARTAWKFTDSKDVSATPSQIGYANQGPIYDILFAQFAVIEPDQAARSRLVNAFLQANNISPAANVASSFLTSAVALQRRQDLSFALLGVRDTITLIASRSESSRLDTVSAGVDDFSNSSVIHQRGLSINYLHRLTPEYSFGVLASRQITGGDMSLQDLTLNLLSINLTGKVGKKTSASVGARRAVFSGGLAPYVESAVTINLLVQF